MSTDDANQTSESRQQLQLLAQTIIAKAKGRSAREQPQADELDIDRDCFALTKASGHADQAQTLNTAAAATVPHSGAGPQAPEEPLRDAATVLHQLPTIQQQAPDQQTHQQQQQRQEPEVRAERQRSLQSLITSLVQQVAVRRQQQQQQQQQQQPWHAQNIPQAPSWQRFSAAADDTPAAETDTPQNPELTGLLAAETTAYVHSNIRGLAIHSGQLQRQQQKTQAAAAAVTATSQGTPAGLQLSKIRIKRGRKLLTAAASSAAAQALQQANTDVIQPLALQQQPTLFNASRSTEQPGTFEQRGVFTLRPGRLQAAQVHSTNQSQQPQQQWQHQQQQHYLTMQHVDPAATMTAAAASTAVDWPTCPDQHQVGSTPAAAAAGWPAGYQLPSVEQQTVLDLNPNRAEQELGSLAQLRTTMHTAGMPKSQLVEQQQQQLQRLEKLQQRVALLRQQLMQQQNTSAGVLRTGTQQPHQQQQQQQQMSGTPTGLEGGELQLQILHNKVHRVLSELQQMMVDKQHARAPVPYFSGADQQAAAAASSAAAAAIYSNQAPIYAVDTAATMQQQYHVSWVSDVIPVSEVATPLLTQQPPQLQQQPSEPWQALYYPGALLPTLSLPYIAKSPAVAAATGLYKPQSPAAAAAAVQQRGLSFAAPNAMHLQQMVQTVEKLPELPATSVGAKPSCDAKPPSSEVRVDRMMNPQCPIDLMQFKQILLRILATQKQAKTLLQQAFQQGLLPSPRQLQGSQQPPASAAVALATVAAAAAGGDDTAAVPDQPDHTLAKRRRTNQNLQQPSQPATVCTEAGPQEMSTAAGLESSEAGLETTASEAAAAATLNAMRFQVSSPAAAAAAVVVEPRSLDSLQQQAQDKSANLGRAPASEPGIPSASLPDAAASLLPQVTAVMADMQHHMQDLARLVLPSAVELVYTRRSADALLKQTTDSEQMTQLDMVNTGRQQGSSASTSGMRTSDLVKALTADVMKLQDDLQTLRSAAATGQQEFAQAQQQLAAVVQQQQQQQQQVVAAVTQLFSVVDNSAALGESDRLLLVTAGAQLLQSVVGQ